MDVLDRWPLSILLQVIRVGTSQQEPLHLPAIGTQDVYLEEDRFKLLKYQAHVHGDFIDNQGLEELTQLSLLASALMYGLRLSQLHRLNKISNQNEFCNYDKSNSA